MVVIGNDVMGQGAAFYLVQQFVGLFVHACVVEALDHIESGLYLHVSIFHLVGQMNLTFYIYRLRVDAECPIGVDQVAESPESFGR